MQLLHKHPGEFWILRIFDFLCIFPCLKRSALCTVRKKISWEVFYQNVHQPSRFWRVTYFPRYLAWHSLTMAIFTKDIFVLPSKYSNHWHLISVNFNFGLHSKKNPDKSGNYFVIILVSHGCVKRTVIEKRQHQLGRMADILPPVTFSVLDL